MRKQTTALMVGVAMAMTAPILTAAPAFAQSSYTGESASSATQSQSFFKKKVKIKGSWTLTERDGNQYISFSDDFKTKKGPDLKIFLSPKSADDVNGINAVEGSVLLGELKNTKGTQEYLVPADVDLSTFSTVLIHCEKYSKLWGGGSL